MAGLKLTSKYFPMVVLGSTFAGLGAAYADRENVLVIDRSALVGYEFINSYNPGERWNETSLTGEGDKLKTELLERGILSAEGKVHIPAIAPVLYNKIREDRLNILLLTDVVGIEEHDGGYEITIYNTSGFQTVRTGKIIDTRLESIPVSKRKSKGINAMLLNGDDSIKIPAVYGERASYIRGKLKGEVILQFSVEKEDNWSGARKKLHQFWLNRPEELKPWTISAIANVFDIRTEKWWEMPEYKRCLLSPAGYANPLEAFEAGLVLAGKEWK